MSITTAGLTTLLAGEDWHYVGDTDEPAWKQVGGVDAWGNGNPNFNLAFRIREAGIVDIQGIIAAAADPPADTLVFFPPEGYRPSSNVLHAAIGATTGGAYINGVMQIRTDGGVEVISATIDPYPGAADAIAVVVLNMQIFLVPASSP